VRRLRSGVGNEHQDQDDDQAATDAHQLRAATHHGLRKTLPPAAQGLRP
jgi:hypothetical protein